MPLTRRAETANPYPPVLILITLIATLGIIRYAAFLLVPGNRGDLLPYLLVVVAELILVVHALLSGWTILTGAKGPRDFPFYEAKSDLFDRRPTASGRPPRAAGVADRRQRTRGHRRRVHPGVRRGRVGDQEDRDRRAGHPRLAPHLDPRRRSLRRGEGARLGAGLPLHPPAQWRAMDEPVSGHDGRPATG